MELQSLIGVRHAPAGRAVKSFVMVVPDGVGIRNFLCSHFLDLLLEHGHVAVWHTLSEATIEPYRRRWGDRVRWDVLPYRREGVDQRVLRQAKILAQLRWFREPGTESLRNGHASERILSRAVGTTAQALGWLFGNRSGTQRLDAWHREVSSRHYRLAPYLDFLGRVRPDCVFCTHQRASRAVPVLLAASRLGIPTATFIYSWDNLPKGRMAVHSDAFLVWGRSMAEELARYYPEVDPSRVHIVGTPQFEHYFNEALIEPRATFLGRLGLDPGRPVLCYSGDDVTTSPHDPIYLADFCGAVRSMPEAERPQILFRRCPVDLSGRYDRVLAAYPEVAVSDPLWVSKGGSDWTGSVPDPADVALLANVVRHCAAVVNVGSTMAMDFAILGKPAIYVNYNPETGGDGWNIGSIYQLPHFRSVHELQPVHWVDSAEGWGAALREVLRHPESKAGAREAWLGRHVTWPPDQASRRCVQALLQVASQGRARCM